MAKGGKPPQNQGNGPERIIINRFAGSLSLVLANHIRELSTAWADAELLLDQAQESSMESDWEHLRDELGIVDSNPSHPASDTRAVFDMLQGHVAALEGTAQSAACIDLINRVGTGA